MANNASLSVNNVSLAGVGSVVDETGGNVVLIGLNVDAGIDTDSN